MTTEACTTESISIEYGNNRTFKLDTKSQNELTRSTSILQREFGTWIERGFVVRRAIRHYLEYLKVGCTDALKEREFIIKAIGGE